MAVRKISQVFVDFKRLYLERKITQIHQNKNLRRFQFDMDKLEVYLIILFYNCTTALTLGSDGYLESGKNFFLYVLPQGFLFMILLRYIVAIFENIEIQFELEHEKSNFL